MPVLRRRKSHTHKHRSPSGSVLPLLPFPEKGLVTPGAAFKSGEVRSHLSVSLSLDVVDLRYFSGGMKYTLFQIYGTLLVLYEPFSLRLHDHVHHLSYAFVVERHRCRGVKHTIV